MGRSISGILHAPLAGSYLTMPKRLKNDLVREHRRLLEKEAKASHLVRVALTEHERRRRRHRSSAPWHLSILPNHRKKEGRRCHLRGLHRLHRLRTCRMQRRTRQIQLHRTMNTA